MRVNENIVKLEYALEFALHLDKCTEYPILLAGGAVRDVLNGREIKDFDFFVDNRAKIALVDKSPYVFDKVSIEYYDNDLEAYNLSSTFLGSRGMQFMFTNMAPEIYIQDKFDIGLCKCWVNIKHGNLHLTEAYEKDVRDCTISVECNDRFNVEHIKRVQDKYLHHNVILNGDPFGLYRKLYENPF